MAKEKLKTVEDLEKETTVEENEPAEETVVVEVKGVEKQEPIGQAEKPADSPEVFKIMTPEPRTFVSFHDGTSVWSDENGIIRVDDAETRDYLLSYAGFKLIPKE
ncbi:hypothetical protein DUK53_14990 [Listeria sp. SHR_NRA_18]|uniref:hypothetical protein n=1 Tax=Listeria sp. SHR_NRA_18 TaxID=2269046 RepID=UPI000F5FB4DB|nr:hypothetical protein [Listeria sp. SHR_NRA_18]RQW65695.1 hypothetical protein DUK53_14990 [Listeria sp. SHR_NRA_18]